MKQERLLEKPAPLLLLGMGELLGWPTHLLCQLLLLLRQDTLLEKPGPLPRLLLGMGGLPEKSTLLLLLLRLPLRLRQARLLE